MENNIARAAVGPRSFFIKAGYCECPAPLDYSGEKYWCQDRMRRSYAIERSVYCRAAKLISSLKLSRVLDYGCGYAVKAYQLIRPWCADLTAIDQEAIIRRCRREFPGIRFLVDDLESPSIEFESPFDCVILADVIEHLLNPDQALEFMHRSVHANSYIIISTPERDVARGSECMRSLKPEHVREWNYREFAAYLEDRDFVVLEHTLVPYAKFSPLKHWQMFWERNVFHRAHYRSDQLVVCRSRRH